MYPEYVVIAHLPTLQHAAHRNAFSIGDRAELQGGNLAHLDLVGHGDGRAPRRPTGVGGVRLAREDSRVRARRLQGPDPDLGAFIALYRAAGVAVAVDCSVGATVDEIGVGKAVVAAGNTTAAVRRIAQAASRHRAANKPNSSAERR